MNNTTKLSNLFSYDEPNRGWQNTKSDIALSIDAAMEKGTCDKEVLEIMKDLLQEISIGTSMTDYIDEVNKDG